MCFGGSSSAENNISQQQAQMFSTLQSNYNQMFSGQQAILNSLNSSVTPVLQAGINQYGFSKPEDAALRTQSDEATAAGYQKVKQATGEALSGIGGGNSFLPSGVEAGINANAATQFAAQQANQQLGITQAGYAQGRQNYLTAANVLSDVSKQMDPLGYAGASTTAGNSAFGSANTINQQNLAAQQAMFGAIGGGITGLLDAIPGNPGGAADILSNAVGAI